MPKIKFHFSKDELNSSGDEVNILFRMKSKSSKLNIDA